MLKADLRGFLLLCPPAGSCCDFGEAGGAGGGGGGGGSILLSLMLGMSRSCKQVKRDFKMSYFS